MKLTRSLLLALGVKPADVNRHLDALVPAMLLEGIDTPMRIAHFLAQVLHESGHLSVLEENLNYSAERLLAVFPRHFRNIEHARLYAHQPERIANRVYGGRMGNGNEASGDGYRYRGRGFIQLTGKHNYQAFADWSDEDVVSNPDAVASTHAALSAVYFWSSRKLNAMADVDDLTAITRRVNGGLNGLEQRVQLLDKAVAWLNDHTPKAERVMPTEVFSPTHIVTASALNLRTHPRVARDTWLATLREGTQLEVLEPADTAGWVKVRVQLGDALRDGVVAERYLTLVRPHSIDDDIPPDPIVDPSLLQLPPPSRVPPAHLRRDRSDITRHRAGGWAFSLGETGRPQLNPDTEASSRAHRLLDIVRWLDVNNPAHQRYWPQGGATYCNIYAHDYCDLAGVYLPRVWWTERALLHWQTGEALPARYDDTVRELNANALHDWLADHGPGFGWHRETSLTTLQAAANSGDVCLIIARRRDLNRSGHVSVVIPEHDTAMARRDRDGCVTRPVESQAGTRNHCVIVHQGSPWWLHERYQSFAFWRCRGV